MSKACLRLDTPLELVAHSYADTIYCVARGKTPRPRRRRPSKLRDGGTKRQEERHMQIAAEVAAPQAPSGTAPLADVSSEAGSAFSQYKVIRRNGAVVGF